MQILNCFKSILYIARNQCWLLLSVDHFFSWVNPLSKLSFLPNVKHWHRLTTACATASNCLRNVWIVGETRHYPLKLNHYTHRRCYRHSLATGYKLQHFFCTNFRSKAGFIICKNLQTQNKDEATVNINNHFCKSLCLFRLFLWC